MLSNLPSVVLRFVDASNLRDLDLFVSCFAAAAVVEDEAQTHRGIDEIREWKRQTEHRYAYTTEPVHFIERDGRTILTATLTGNFPGSPANLTYEFTIADDAITALSIHPERP